jgi:hypothetical protein
VKFPPATIARIWELIGNSGMTRADFVRVAVDHTIEKFSDPEYLARLEAEAQLQRLEELAARWPGAAGRTPAGSYWAATPDRMPEALALGEMVATPAGLVARLWGGSFTLDMEEQQLQLLAENGKAWAVPIDRKSLAQLVPAWAGALIPLATSEPGAVFKLPLGLALERDGDGGLFVTGGGIRLGLTAGEAFQISGELASLLASRLRHEGERAMALNAALAATPEPVEVAK